MEQVETLPEMEAELPAAAAAARRPLPAARGESGLVAASAEMRSCKTYKQSHSVGFFVVVIVLWERGGHGNRRVKNVCVF